MPFPSNSELYEKNYPRNINHIPAVILFASLDFGKNCYSRTASWCFGAVFPITKNLCPSVVLAGIILKRLDYNKINAMLLFVDF